MNIHILKLTPKMSKFLFEKSHEFLYKNLKDEEHTSDIINLIISSHLNSMKNMASLIAENSTNPSLNQKVKLFMDGILEYIQKNSIVSLKVQDLKDMK